MLRILMRSAGLFLLATVFATGTAAAQRGQFVLEQIDQNANFTRSQLERLLQQYPPSFGEVLRLDPSQVEPQYPLSTIFTTLPTAIGWPTANRFKIAN